MNKSHKTFTTVIRRAPRRKLDFKCFPRDCAALIHCHWCLFTETASARFKDNHNLQTFCFSLNINPTRSVSHHHFRAVNVFKMYPSLKQISNHISQTRTKIKLARRSSVRPTATLSPVPNILNINSTVPDVQIRTPTKCEAHAWTVSTRF
jgi:hypothetical protein